MDGLVWQYSGEYERMIFPKIIQYFQKSFHFVPLIFHLSFYNLLLLTEFVGEPKDNVTQVCNWKQNCHTTQQSQCWAYTPRKVELKETRVPQCSSQHCLLQPGHGSNLARCPLTDKWIRKLWYIYAIKYLSAIKKNAFESVLMRWMKLEPIIQSEVSQKEKYQYSILTHIYGI